jgi:hypothetical protein
VLLGQGLVATRGSWSELHSNMVVHPYAGSSQIVCADKMASSDYNKQLSVGHSAMNALHGPACMSGL